MAITDLFHRDVPYLVGYSSPVRTSMALVEFLLALLGVASVLRTLMLVWDHGLEHPVTSTLLCHALLCLLCR